MEDAHESVDERREGEADDRADEREGDRRGRSLDHLLGDLVQPRDIQALEELADLDVLVAVGQQGEQLERQGKQDADVAEGQPIPEGESSGGERRRA